MHLERMRLFAELVKRRNYSKTADELGVSKGYLSKQIKALESELGAQLLLRNTRSMKLTTAGETLLSHANQLLSFWQDTQNLLSDSVERMSGTVRFTAPTGLMEYSLLPVVSDIRERFPDLNIISETSNQTHNLVSAPYDFAVRLTNTPPDDMIAVKLMSAKYVCCASPDFLDKTGIPASPADLLDTDCITLSYWKTWSFYQSGKKHDVDVEGKLQCSDNTLLKASALAGLGVTRLADYQIREEIEAGKLVVLFEDYVPETRDVYLVYPQVMHRPERVNVVIEAIKNAFD